MPLEEGSGRETVGNNISELMKSGRKQSQAVAISLKKAGLSNQESMESRLPCSGVTKSQMESFETKLKRDAGGLPAQRKDAMDLPRGK